jgi:hypothetical protein
MPTSLDLPLIDTVLVEVTNPGQPFGLCGVGEVRIVQTAGRHRQRHQSRRWSAHAAAEPGWAIAWPQAPH